jgi:hypothetical protein
MDLVTIQSPNMSKSKKMFVCVWEEIAHHSMKHEAKRIYRVDENTTSLLHFVRLFYSLN